jgi:hypothetical protein
MALTFYASFAEDLADAGLDWVADTINIMILTNTYTFSAAHAFRSSITNEVTGTGYSAGGLALDSKTATLANPCVMSSADEVIAQSGGGFSTGRKYVLAKILGGAASADPLITYGVAGADFGNVAGALTLDVPTSFITITV